jgi:hypothetical protein
LQFYICQKLKSIEFLQLFFVDDVKPDAVARLDRVDIFSLGIGDYTSSGGHEHEDSLNRHSSLYRRVLAVHGAGVHATAAQ